jgi:hypothetical protein
LKAVATSIMLSVISTMSGFGCRFARCQQVGRRASQVAIAAIDQLELQLDSERIWLGGLESE